MAHLKRLVAPKTWPIKRKGAIFVTRQNSRAKSSYSMPLAVVLRDLLKVAEKSREVKRMLQTRDSQLTRVKSVLNLKEASIRASRERLDKAVESILRN